MRTFLFVLVTILLVGAELAAGAEPSPAPAGPAAAAEKTVTTASGLRYVDLVVGSGPTPKPGQTVVIKYTISADEKRLAGSREGQPFAFAVGKDQALKGLDEGVSTMKAGGHRKLTVPPSLGYGPQGVENRVPPNATLDIDVELLEIKK